MPQSREENINCAGEKNSADSGVFIILERQETQRQEKPAAVTLNHHNKMIPQ